MSLDLSSLQKAVGALAEAISVIQNQDFYPSLTTPQKNTLQAGVIQYFEFTYELSWKFIQRWIKNNKNIDDAEPRTRKELFRIAARYHLIQDPAPWFVFAEARNSTSHTYDLDIAEQVCTKAVEFLPAAKYLLKQLEAMND